MGGTKMVFESKEFYVDSIEAKDLEEILEVYNSNTHFLTNHMNINKVTTDWILEELASMKGAGFHSCKIVERSSGKIVGIIDFRTGEETYLSLLMIHNDFKSKGLGRLIFHSFEKYIKSLKSKCIRIDVVTNYDDSVIDFWIKNGFIKFKDVELNWTGKILPAAVMKKYL
jgi:L-amino acid N-acyltransferase YncA